MNVMFKYDIQNNKLFEDIKKIEKLTQEKGITLLNEYNLRKKLDLLVIFSEDINEIHKYTDKIINKVKYILIVTQNLKTEHILACIEITPYIIHFNCGTNKIVNKILEIGNKRNETSN